MRKYRIVILLVLLVCALYLTLRFILWSNPPAVQHKYLVRILNGTPQTVLESSLEIDSFRLYSRSHVTVFSSGDSLSIRAAYITILKN